MIPGTPTPPSRATLVVLLAALHASLLAAAGADWPSWRGPHHNGTAEPGSYPVRWDEDTNLLWKARLPGTGCSTPVVRGQVIFLTAPLEGDDATLAFDWSGKLLWQTKLGPEAAGRHRNGSGSNPSPVTDSESVFVSFRSGTLAALRHDGSLRWKTNLVDRFGKDTLYWSHGSSPVLTSDCVVVTRIHHGDSWLAAFDKTSGELRWKVARNYQTPTENDNSYSTPLVLDRDGRQSLLVWGAEQVTEHDAGDGRLLWSCGGFNADGKANWPVVATPVVVGDIALVSFGRSDRRIPRLHGIRLGGTGDVTASHRAWKRDDTGSFVPTPATSRGRVYLLQDLGTLDCLDPATGKTIWSGSFPKSKAKFYGSPVIAGNHLYAVREDGAFFVVDIAEGFKLIAENHMGEKVIASPVLVANRILVRGETHLFCLGAG